MSFYAKFFTEDAEKKFFGGDAGFLGGFENKLVEFVRYGNADGFFFGSLFCVRNHNSIIVFNFIIESRKEIIFFQRGFPLVSRQLIL